MNKHNLEKLFQEKFKDFEPEIPEVSWQNIKNQLPNDKPKKSYFWYKLSGFVALFIISFFILNNINSNENLKIQNIFKNKTKSIITNQDKTNKKIDTNVNNSKSIITSKEKSIENNSKINNSNNVVINQKNEIILNNKLTQKNDKSIVTKFNIKQKNNQNISLNNKKNNIKSQNLIIPNKETNQIKKYSKDKTNNQNNYILSENSNSISENSENSEKINNNNNSIENKDKNNSKLENDYYFQSNNNQIVNNIFTNSKEEIAKEKIAFSENKKDSTLSINSNFNLLNLKNDSLKVLVLENEKNKSNINKKHKWQFSSLIAPIFINNFSDNSSINPVLDQNEKQNFRSLSYGAYLQYQITPKLGIRSGIAHLNSIQQTNNVAFISQMDSNNSIFKQSSITFLPSNNNNDQELLFRKTNTGILKQEINYFEIPLELNYLLIDKKLQFNVLGGASLLVLSNDNSYLRTSENQIINLGSANNLNQNHYSINFAFGASYPIFSNMRFQLQPTVRYQINTFNQYSNKPYYLGIFTGISFNF